MKPRKTQILTLLILTLFSCSTDPVLYEHDSDALYYVYCTLNPLAENQEVLLGKTFPESRPINVTDATITISSATDTGRFVYVRDGIYKDLMDPLEITKGESYSLQVNLPNGRVFTGKTTVPGDFHILDPAPGDTIDYTAIQWPDTLNFPRIHWTKSPGAYFYSVNLENNEKIVATTFQLYKNSTYFPEFWWSATDAVKENDIIPATLNIAASDSGQDLRFVHRNFKNYHGDWTFEEYMRIHDRGQQIVVPLEIESKNVSSPLGAFSAITIDSCQLYLRIHTE